MINISIGEVLHVNGLEVEVTKADNIGGKYTVKSTFDENDIWTVDTNDFDEI